MCVPARKSPVVFIGVQIRIPRIVPGNSRVSDKFRGSTHVCDLTFGPHLQLGHRQPPPTLLLSGDRKWLHAWPDAETVSPNIYQHMVLHQASDGPWHAAAAPPPDQLAV